MPLYEYQCQQCQRRIEKIQKFSDAPLTTCPHCGGVLERTLTAPAIQFKGSGWYKDLYSSAKPAAAAGDPGENSGSAKSREGSAPTSNGGDKAGTPATPAASSTPAPAASSSSSGPSNS